MIVAVEIYLIGIKIGKLKTIVYLFDSKDWDFLFFELVLKVIKKKDNTIQFN